MRTLLALVLVMLAAVPAVLVRFVGLDLPVELATLCFGAAVVGAAFAISWAAEASERDIPRALSLTLVALLAVLPEYAVDVIFAFRAGQDPAFAPFAAANMTGSNRLLLGLGWPTVAVVAWLATSRRLLHLERGDLPGLVFLALATLYSFSLPFRGSISPLDSALLIGLFLVYAVIVARQPAEEPHLVGPAAAIGALPTAPRRLAVLALFAFGAGVIGMSAEPFAEGLVHTGQTLGIDEFLLVQWLAPLASETPEFVVAVLLATRGKATAALGLLVAAKVNQWTLLVGSLALSYSVGAGHLAALPLDDRQSAEVLLTAAQSLFGLAVLASLTLSLWEAGLLALLFVGQLALSGVLRAGLHDAGTASTEMLWFSALYIVLGCWQLYRARGTFGISARSPARQTGS